MAYELFDGYNCTCCGVLGGTSRCECAADVCRVCRKCVTCCEAPGLHGRMLLADYADIEPLHPNVPIDGHQHYAGQHCAGCEDLFKEDFLNARDHRREIRSGRLDHVLTVEDCALLWSLGIRVDEDMADAHI